MRHYIARLSADQTSNVTLNSHIEFDSEDGDLATVSTGSGQANGLITVAEDGFYLVQLTVQGICSNGLFRVRLYKNGSEATDVTGYAITSYSNDNLGSDTSEYPTVQSVFYFEAGDELKAEIVNDNNFSEIDANHTSLVMLELPGDAPTSLMTLDFTGTSKPGLLDTYDRASVCAPITGVDGSGNVEVTKFASGEYAYAYNENFTHASKLGMLVEPAATNLLPYSEFDASETGWNNQGGNFSTFDGGVGTAPDGTSTAIDVAVVSGVTGEVRTASAFSAATGDNVISFFARSDDVSPPGVGIFFYGTTYSAATTGITLTNEWARYEFTANVAGGSTNMGLRITGPNQSAQFWGIQVEAGTKPTSYIPTAGATASRVETDWAVTNLVAKGFIDHAQGELEVTYVSPTDDASAVDIRIDATSGTNDEKRLIRDGGTGTSVRDSSGTIQSALSLAVPAADIEEELRLQWDSAGGIDSTKEAKVLADDVEEDSTAGTYTAGTQECDLTDGSTSTNYIIASATIYGEPQA